MVRNGKERWVFEARKPFIISMGSKKYHYRWKLIEGPILSQPCGEAITKEMEKFLHGR